MIFVFGMGGRGWGFNGMGARGGDLMVLGGGGGEGQGCVQHCPCRSCIFVLWMEGLKPCN